VGLCLFVILRWLPRRWSLWAAALAWTLAWSGFLLLVNADPWGVVDWWLD
jgi:hypothetical protein